VDGPKMADELGQMMRDQTEVQVFELADEVTI
jgi:hypothetical protein